MKPVCVLPTEFERRMVSLKGLKKVALTLPVGSAFREVMLSEPDEISINDFLSKILIYDHLASLEDKKKNKS